MSGYALPGMGLFPPLAESASSAISTTLSSMASSASSAAERLSGGVMGAATAATAAAAGSSSSEGQKGESIDTSEPPPPLTAVEDADEVDIVVQEAKIDPAQLIQSLATASSSTPSSSFAAASSSSSLKKAPASSKSRHHPERRCRPRSSAGTFKTNSGNPLNVTPQEESTQFELRISFNGRTYTATRSLTCILRLRQDLVSEIQECQQQEEREQRKRDCDGSDEGNNPQPPKRSSICIPEVPRMMMQGDAAMPGETFVGSAAQHHHGGVVGRGFSFLQALIRSYTPALEGWLRQVTVIVPPKDSPSLMQFLWEPLVRRTSSETARVVVGSSASASLSSLQHLDIIEESENDCTDEE